MILKHRLILIILMLLPVSFSAGAQVNAEQVMTIGRNVLSMEDYMLAIQYFNQAIKAKPYLPDPYFYRALAKLSLDDYKGAEADCSKALSLNKFKTEAYKLRGFARQNLGLDSLAIADYDIGLEYNPTDKQFLYYKGVAQSEMKDYPGAEATFATLLRIYPGFEEGFAARGRMNLEKGDTIAALADIDHSIRLSRSLLNAWLVRARINSSTEKWEDAVKDMDEAIRLRPDDPDFYLNRAYLRYNADDFYGAMSDYNYALQIDPKYLPALYNRALLRYEVKDLNHAAADFSEVLKLDPDNFHALYNRGLIYLEAGNSHKALEDFNLIKDRYPKFYPVYYAIAQARRDMGDFGGSMRNIALADDLVRKYVDNPEKNPLDRPTIQSGSTADYGTSPSHEGESETEVMDRFNRLVTVTDIADTQLSYNEKIKGRVQDRNVRIEPEPMYAISFAAPSKSLRSMSNYFRELDDFNAGNYSPLQLYLVPQSGGALENSLVAKLFEMDELMQREAESGSMTLASKALRGVVLSSLKNYPAAIEEFDAAISEVSQFTVAYFGRAYARYANALATMRAEEQSSESAGNEQVADSKALSRRVAMQQIAQAVSDYDQAIALNPRLVYAWFNKGIILYDMLDYKGASECFSKAISIDPEFGQAYFNRGLCYFHSGQKHEAFADLSRAGELGVLPSYNLIKRMQ